MDVDMEGFGEQEGYENDRKEIGAGGCPAMVEMGLGGSGNFDGEDSYRFKLSTQSLGKTTLQLPGGFHDMYKKKKKKVECVQIMQECCT